MQESAGLAAKIARRIRREGPLSIAAFMAMALHDPEAGYYTSRDPFGPAGDFITAPEISQIFGELIGVCIVDFWQCIGRPDPVILAELGPGRGTLMGDLLRAVHPVPEFRRALRLHLVEASPVLRLAQRRHLAATEPGFPLEFGDSIDALPDGPLLLVANEFLDALPVRQLVRRRHGWAERLVALDEAGRLVFAEGPENPTLALLIPAGLRDLPPWTIFEVCPAAAALAAALGARLARRPGLALFIDYGRFPSRPGSTLAAVRRHAASSLLEVPGEADLSAHVDFAAFAEAAAATGAAVHGPVPQGSFLRSLGAEARLAALAGRATAAQRARLESGLARLIDPADMGNLFKVLALTSPGLPAPAGLACCFAQTAVS